MEFNISTKNSIKELVSIEKGLEQQLYSVGEAVQKLKDLQPDKIIGYELATSYEFQEQLQTFCYENNILWKLSLIRVGHYLSFNGYAYIECQTAGDKTKIEKFLKTL